MLEFIWCVDVWCYLKDFGVYQVVEWIDCNFIICWLEFVFGNQEVIGFNVVFFEECWQDLEIVWVIGKFDVFGVINLCQGGQGFVIYVLVGIGSVNNGYIVGVFWMEVLVQ